MKNPSYLQKPDRGDPDDFRIPAAALVAALEKARAEDVPTYCPTLLGEVLALWKSAHNKAATTGSTSQVRKLLEKAMEKLGQASERATSSRDTLSDLVRLRSDSQRNIWERYYAPEILIEAERHYGVAVQEAENGNLEAASEHAAAAGKLFRDATVQSLERGPIAHLENKVIEAEESVPQGRLQEAVRELAGLREIVAKTRQGDLTVSALRSRIIVGSNAIQALLSQAPDLGLDWRVSDSDLGLPEIGGLDTPDAPVEMGVLQGGENYRTENCLTVVWFNLPSSGDRNQLFRQKDGGAFELLKEFGRLSGYYQHPDEGLQPDTRYCYKIRTVNAFTGGHRTTLPENYACGYTRGPLGPDGNRLVVWRVQLTIRIADFPDAGTGDGVNVLLNSPGKETPSGNSTWLDYGPRYISLSWPPVWSDDFDRGREFPYDLDISRISELSDITMITIAKEGTDAIGIAEISLKVNGKEVFKRHFGEAASTCLWLNEANGYSPRYTISHPELRAHPLWQAYIENPPARLLTFQNDEIVSRLESIIGNLIHGTPVYWGKTVHAPLRATRLNDETLRVEVHLRADITGFDPVVDLYFDVHFETKCEAGTATFIITIKNLIPNIDANILYVVITGGGVDFFIEILEHEITKRFQPIVEEIVVDIDELGRCPKVKVHDTGEIEILLTEIS